MGLCPIMSSGFHFVDCKEENCARWDKQRKCCIDITASSTFEEVFKACDNLAREINLAVLRQPTKPDKD